MNEIRLCHCKKRKNRIFCNFIIVTQGVTAHAIAIYLCPYNLACLQRTTVRCDDRVNFASALWPFLQT